MIKVSCDISLFHDTVHVNANLYPIKQQALEEDGGNIMEHDPDHDSRSILSIGSVGSILSIGSTGSILSIGSAGSILSIGSAGSILSIGSVASLGSFFSAASMFSFRSFLSIGGWQSYRGRAMARR